MVRLAVVGGRGWVGRAVADAARRTGSSVVIVARPAGPGAGLAPSSPAPSSPGPANPSPIDLALADPTDLRSLAAATAGCDVVVNAAGCVAGTDRDLAEANVDLPDRLGRLAAAEGWRLVHLGSAAEYGTGAAGPHLVGEDHPCAPTSPYGRTKLAGTEAVTGWRASGARAVVARVFNVVDTVLPAANPIADIVRQVRTAVAGGEPGVVALGDPTTERDLSGRAWVAGAVVALALLPPDQPGRRDHAVVNVCSGRATAFGELARAVAWRAGAHVAVEDLGWSRGGRIVGDPGRLRTLVPALPTETGDELVTTLAAAVTAVPEGPAPTAAAPIPGAAGEEGDTPWPHVDIENAGPPGVPASPASAAP